MYYCMLYLYSKCIYLLHTFLTSSGIQKGCQALYSRSDTKPILGATQKNPTPSRQYTASLPTNIVDFRGFDSSIMLFLRGGILRPIGDFPESLSQAILVGVVFVGKLGV